MKKSIIVAGALLLTILPVWGGNRLEMRNIDSEVSLNLSTIQELAGLAVALKFADKNDDITITGYSFEGTRLENLSLKEVIIDNVEKTVVVYGIVLNEANIALGEGPIVKLTTSGKDVNWINFTSTTVGKQEGTTLVTPQATEVPHEMEQNINITAGLPTSFDMAQNFPNPFNATTTIRYSLPEPANVRLAIFNILGQKVKTLVNEVQTAGYKQVVWNGKNDQGDNVSSGVYFYRINAGKFNQNMKMSLLK